MSGPLAMKGVVTSCGKMQKTATVTVSRRVMHPVIGKVFQRTKKYLVHDPSDACKLGDQVVIQNCKPISKRKTFQYIKTLVEARGNRMIEARAAAGDETLQSASSTVQQSHSASSHAN